MCPILLNIVILWREVELFMHAEYKKNLISEIREDLSTVALSSVAY